MEQNQIQELTSKRFALNVKDFLRGLLMAIGTASFVVVEAAINTGSLTTVNWKNVAVAGIGGGLIYLGKNYLTPAQVKTTISNEKHDELKASSPEAVNAAK